MFEITPRDEMILKNLYPKFASAIRVWMSDCFKDKLPVHLTCGFRYYGETDVLFSQGKTNAKGGESKHNFCLAVDWCFDNDEKPGIQDPYHEPFPGAWEMAAKKAQDLGLISGFFFKSISDKDHIEAKTKATCQELHSVFIKTGREGLFAFLDQNETI